MFLKCIASGSKGNAYALIAENEILLLECGMPMKAVKKAIDYNILKIKGCLLSHRHSDHLKYVREFLQTGITVYTNEETVKEVNIAYGEKMLAMPEFQPFAVGGFRVTPFYVPHNGTPCYAYLIQQSEIGTLLFATDFEYLPWTFKQYKINHLLIECNYDMQMVDRDIPNYKHKLLGHASLETCKEVVAKNRSNDLQNVILCHLSLSNADPIRMIADVSKVAGLGAKVYCAAPGLQIELMKEPF